MKYCHIIVPNPALENCTPITMSCLDAKIFMYAEDIEWCCRIRDAGFRVAYLSRLEITHLQGASAKKQTDRGFSNLWLANLRALYFRDHPRQPRFIYDTVVATGIIARIVLRICLYPVRLIGRRASPDTQRIGTLCSYLRFVLAGFGGRGTVG